MGLTEKTALHPTPAVEARVSKEPAAASLQVDWHGGAAQRAFAATIHGSDRQTAQRALIAGIENSPRQAGQRATAKQLSASPPVQARRIAMPQDPGGLPAQLRAGIESLSGMDMSDVRVHRNSGQPAQLQAAAFADGRDIHLGPGQEQHLPHEAWHVVQQRQGRVRATLQAKGVDINDDPALEREADVMGDRAMQLKAAPESSPPSMALRGSSPARGPIQCNYGALGPMAKARVDQQAEEKYAAKALEFELGMAQRIMADPVVNHAVDLLLGIIRNIVDAWAEHTGKTKAVTYEKEFGWPPGDGYYGAFEATAQNITALFADPAKPMRMKLKLVYNAVRNNNLSKWLKIAAVELDRQAKGKTERDWRIKTDSHKVQYGPGEARIRKATSDDTVTAGFAAKSGLNSRLTTPQVAAIAATAARERVTDGWFSSTKRDVFTHDSRSNVMGWHDNTRKADKDRRPFASRDLTVDQQRTLTVQDIPDLTDEEIDLALKRQGNHAPDVAARGTYRGLGANKLPWTQGGEFYDLKLGSESAVAASQVKGRLEAGISGSTDLMLHAAENLGITNPTARSGLRLALAGWMMANRDHSFYEVFKAAQSYGQLFNLDPANPGAEYEDAGNLQPMQRADFIGILANDGVLNNVFPRDYLSLAWKDALALALPNPAHDAVAVKGALAGRGVSGIALDVMSDREAAAMQRLDEVVAAQPINAGDAPAVKAQALRRIRLHPAFIYLGNTLGEVRAGKLLNSLLLSRHAGAGVAKDDVRTRLENAGLPKVILDFVSPAELARLEAVRVAVAGAAVVPVTGVVMGPITAALALSKLPDWRKSQVKAALIRKYHGDAQVPAGDRAYADVLNRIAQVEEIAQMEKTTGTWYTWGGRGGHLANMGAASLRDATSAVPSTQGPGLYIGRKVTTSSGYGDTAGLRVMVVKMSGVPTVNKNNPDQMARLRRLAGGGMDPLEAADLYSASVRTEFLMIYGAGNFARLTTNRGVEMTLDLKAAPAADLMASFRGNGGLWIGESKNNFRDQARESGLDISTW